MAWEQINRTQRSKTSYQEQFNSLKIISFQHWIVLFACVLALCSLFAWSISARVQNKTDYQTSRYTQPITLAFPALKRHFHQG